MRTTYPRRAAEYAELGDLLAGAFFPLFPEWRERFVRDARKDPGVKPHYVRVLRRRGRLVAHAGIYEKTIRFGRAVMRMGGIGGVACHPSFRRHGLAAVCMKDALAVMRAEGLPVSFLMCGIEHYYTRFGYVDCWPEYSLHLSVKDLRDLPAPRTPLTARPYRARDLDALVGLHNAAAAATPCSVVRDRACFAHAIRRLGLLEPERGAPGGALYIFAGQRGSAEPRAYLVWKKGAFQEAGVAPGDEEACAALLAFMRDRRVESIEQNLVLANLGPAHPLWLYASRFRHVTHGGLQWFRGGMGLILHVPGFLKDLRPELEARLNAAGMEAEVHLHLIVDGALHSLILNRAHHLALNALGSRAILHARLECSAQALLQLATGALPLAAIPGLKLTGERAVAAAAFPQAAPGIHRLDYF